MIKESELILNSDGSIYHLHLRPEDIANTIITVGDPERVDLVAQRFDQVLLSRSNREFKTITGELNGKTLSVISTGIGTDNIDIVFNELDALVNIDFKNREIKESKTQLNFIRIGTSGSLQQDIAVDSFIRSEYAIGLDALGHYYARTKEHSLDQAFEAPHYIVRAPELQETFKNIGRSGVTITAPGFYAPQCRSLRLQSIYSKDTYQKLSIEGKKVTNLEMETAGIYLLAKALGHRAISLNAILANRATGEFSRNGSQTVNRLIDHSLECILDIN